MSDSVPGAIPGLLLRLRGLAFGEGVKARTVRSSIWAVGAFGGAQALRLASNLILTRLLFPEAFGIMAIVQVFLTGLALLSDTGTRVSVVQNARGDDTAFLDTIFTIQIGRGVLLWLAACGLALPLAALYDEPLLAQILPVAGLNALISGFNPTAVFTADRHLRIGRVMGITLAGQAIGIVAMIALAWVTGSIWALVVGGLVGALAKLALFWLWLPGARNRLRWEPRAGREIFHFGKYIFGSSAFGFLASQADRAILGVFVTLAELGIYNIAYFLAAVPYLVAEQLRTKVLLPLYRMRPMDGSDDNRRQVFRLRRLITAAAIAGNAVLGLSSVVLIEWLYDPRYAAAGPMMALMSLAFVPRLVVLGSGEVLLAKGDSRRFLILIGTIATAQTILLFAGILTIGLVGAILAPGIAILITLPLRIAYARRYEAWDAAGEAVALVAGLLASGAACWIWRDEIRTLFG